MIKWIKIFLATLVSFLVCYYTGEFFSFTGFTFAWVLNFTLMAWYTYIDSLFIWKLDADYFKAKPFEKGGSIYRFVGVHYFRKLLVLVGWEKISRKGKKLTKSRESFELAEYGSRNSEAGHTLIFFIVLMVTFLVADSLQQAFWLLFLNLLLNVYPVFVQRFNRPRYRRILQKMKDQRKRA